MVGCVDDIAKFKGINLEIIDPNGEFVAGGAAVPKKMESLKELLKKKYQLMEHIQLWLMQMENLQLQIHLLSQNLVKLLLLF